MVTLKDGVEQYHLPPVLQADAAISQANPVSATWYTVLATKSNVRLISIQARIDWAVTQPTLVVRVTIDGNIYLYTIALPVTATSYYANNMANLPEALQTLQATDQSVSRGFLLEGRSVKVEVNTVWAVTQPNPIIARVRYAKW